MTKRPDTVVGQSNTAEDVDVSLFARIVQLFRHSEREQSQIEKLFGAALHLSEQDRRPADKSVLRPFSQGRARDEELDVESDHDVAVDRDDERWDDLRQRGPKL